MLYLRIPEMEDLFNEKTQEFESFKGCVLKLEHSLLSVSKWESIYHKSFLSTDLTKEEIISYVKCMTINSVDEEVYRYLTNNNIEEVNEYIKNPMTASSVHTYGNSKKAGGEKIITSELIYYWMIAQQIPFECEKWHLNRLIMLIQICSVKNEQMQGKSKKVPKSEILRNNANLNAARKAAMHSKGKK